MRASSAVLLSEFGRALSAAGGFGALGSPSELVASALSDVVSNAVGSVLGAVVSETAPPTIALAPLAIALGESVAAGIKGSDGVLLPCGAFAGVDGSDLAGAGGFGLALRLDRHCTKSRLRMAARITSRSSLRKPLPLGSSSSRYSTPSLLSGWEFNPKKEGPLMRPRFPDSVRMVSLATVSACTALLRKIAGSPLRGVATGASSFSGSSTTCVAVLRFTSGDGNCALAMAAAREASPAPRRSSMRRSMRVPHMPQNFIPGSFTWPHSAQVVLPDLCVRRSACRLSRRTPQLPQNLYSGRFSVPQKVQSMRALTPLSAALAHVCPKTAAQLFN